MPKIFGWQHLTYLAVAIILMIIGWTLIKKFVKKENHLRLVFFILGIVELGLISWNRICTNIGVYNPIMLLPTTFCGTTSFVFAMILIFGKKDSKPLQFITMCAFLGGLLTLIYPDFIGQNASVFYPPTISGLLHHTFLLFTSVLVIITKYLVPTFKKWSSLIVGLCAFMAYGAFQIGILKRSNSMQIMKPLISGTALNFALVGFLFVVLYTVFLLVYERFALPKEDRFTHRLPTYIKNIKNSTRFDFLKINKNKNKIKEDQSKDLDESEK